MHKQMIMLGAFEAASALVAPAWSRQLNVSCMRRFAGWVMVKASAGFLSTSSD